MKAPRKAARHMPPKAPTHVSLDAAAKAAGVTRRTVQNKLSSGDIPASAVKLRGRQKLVSVAALKVTFGELHPFHENDHETGVKKGEDHGKGVNGEGSDAPSPSASDVLDHPAVRAVIEAKNAHIASLERQLDKRQAEMDGLINAIHRGQFNLLMEQNPTAAIAHLSKNASDATVLHPIPTQEEQPPHKGPTETAQKAPRPRFKSRRPHVSRTRQAQPTANGGGWAWVRGLFARAPKKPKP